MVEPKKVVQWIGVVLLSAGLLTGLFGAILALGILKLAWLVGGAALLGIGVWLFRVAKRI